MKDEGSDRNAPKKRRTIIDLPESDLQRLEALAEENSVPRAAVLREAVAEYIARQGKGPAPLKPLAGFGALQGCYRDGQAWQDKLRKEWE
jgi:hypothetical protein